MDSQNPRHALDVSFVNGKVSSSLLDFERDVQLTLEDYVRVEVFLEHFIGGSAIHRLVRAPTG